MILLLRRSAGTYQHGAVPRGEGDDVGAGDDAGAAGLDGRLDIVDDVVTADRVGVRESGFLADEGPHVVEENRGVAALQAQRYQIN
jgi:hypothetical protein